MAPDAVVRLIQRTDQIGTGIGERKTFAPPQMTERVDVYAIFLPGLKRHQFLKVEFPGRLEQYTRGVPVQAFQGVRRPGRVTHGQVKLFGVGRFVVLPLGDESRESKFREGLTEICGERFF